MVGLLQNYLAGPFVHGNGGSGTDVDRAGGTERLNKADVVGFCEEFLCNAGVFGAENQGCVSSESLGMKLFCARGVVFDGD